MNATLSRRYDTGRAVAVFERARSLQANGGPIAVTAALAGMREALKAGDAEGTEGAAHLLAEAVRNHRSDEDAAYVRGEDNGGN